jgi:hypothetical protein
MAHKVIISVAITGGIHTPTMSDYLPVTPDEIATQAIDAAKTRLMAGPPQIQKSSCSFCPASNKTAMRS